jgi:hypothetical protein
MPCGFWLHHQLSRLRYQVVVATGRATTTGNHSPLDRPHRFIEPGIDGGHENLGRGSVSAVI